VFNKKVCRKCSRRCVPAQKYCPKCGSALPVLLIERCRQWVRRLRPGKPLPKSKPPDDGLPLEPSVLSYGMAGWGHCGVEWCNGVLLYSRSESALHAHRTRRECKVTEEEVDPVIESTPPPSEWRFFWSMVDSLGVWEWKGRYGEGIVCGAPWSLELKRGDRHMSFGGNGNEQCPGFSVFESTLMRLVEQGTMKHDATQHLGE
jgi:hypothetical protein